MEKLCSGRAMLEAIERLDSPLVLFPCSRDGDVLLVDGAELGADAMAKLRADKAIKCVVKDSGTFIDMAFIQSVEELNVLPRARAVRSASQDVWTKAAGRDIRPRPVSKLSTNEDGVKEIHTGYALGMGKTFNEGVRRMWKSDIAVPEPERHIVPYFQKDKTTVSVEVADRYSWEFDGERFESIVSARDNFRARQRSIFEKNFVSVLLNGDDPVHAVMYDLDISGAVHVKRSHGVVQKPEETKPQSASNEVLLAFCDVQERTAQVPAWGKPTKCKLSDVPDEVHRDPEWSRLEYVVRRGGVKYRDQMALELKRLEWDRVCASAREHLDCLAEAGIETSFEDKLRSCGVGIVETLREYGDLCILSSELSKFEFYCYLRECALPEPRVLTREMLDWCLHRATPEERERYGDCVGPEFDELEKLVLEGAWQELLWIYPDRFHVRERDDRRYEGLDEEDIEKVVDEMVDCWDDVEPIGI